MFTIVALYGKGYGVSTSATAGLASKLFDQIVESYHDIVAVFMYGPDGALIAATNVKPPVT